MARLSEDTRMGAVRLRVSDLDRQAAFYSDVLGLHAGPGESPDGSHVRAAGTGAGAAAEDGSDELALRADADGPPLIVLVAAPGAPPAPRPSTGLFHVALLLPSRGALADAILRVRRAGWPFQGFADHAVSEAAYLADAEGNGLELYADRPRSAWTRKGDELHMTTEPLDLEGLLSEAGGGSAPAGLDGRTVVGHVHLRVSSIRDSERFYVDRLGFDVTVRGYPGALFVSAGGYHHHLGLNEWAGKGIPRPPAGSRGLMAFDVVVPDPATRERVRHDLGGETIEDPDGNLVRVVGRPA